jgi:hypothetical protein
VGLCEAVQGGRYETLVALLIVILCTAAPAFAESTAEMVSSCKELADANVRGDTVAIPQDFPSGLCWGAFSSLQRVIVRAYPGGQPIFRVCAPPKSTRSQLITVFVEYARRNPQRLHEDFLDVALEALRGAFPCQPA